jgi:anti-anti-sigma factor
VVLRIDTSGLSFMDSSGLACLLEAHREGQARGASLEVIPSPAVSRLVELTGSRHLLKPDELPQAGER